MTKLAAATRCRSTVAIPRRGTAATIRVIATASRPHSLSTTAGPSGRLAPTLQTHRTLSTSPITASQSTGPTEHSDAVIVGGGVVGLALACALSASPQLASSNSLTGSPLQLALLEASDLAPLRDWARRKEESYRLASQQPRGSRSAGEDGIDWENRVVSLTTENWTWLTDIGVAGYLVHHRIKPVTSMHVTDGLSGAALDLGDSTSGNALSKMVELSNLQQAMLRFLEAQRTSPDAGVRVQVWDKTKVEDISSDNADPSVQTLSQHNDAWPVLSLSSSNDPTSTRRVRPRLLIGADGGSSPVRKYAGIEKYGWSYGRKGLVGTLRFNEHESHQRGDQIAYQRFLPSGTIAWLPLSSSSASTVWTLPPEVTQALTQLHRSASPGEPSILVDLITAAWRLPWSALSDLFALITEASPSIEFLRGEIRSRLLTASENGTLISEEEVPPPVISVDARSIASFPLQVSHADAYLGSSLLSTASPSNSLLPANLLHSALRLTGFAGEEVKSAAKGRTVLVGDAAHSIHPLAGQGLNLGLRDVRVLSETLSQATSVGGDWGSHESLKGYERATYLHNQVVLSGVDHLHWLYAATPTPKSLNSPREQQQGGTAIRDFVAQDVVGRSVVWARSTGVEVLNEWDWLKGKMQGFAGSDKK